MHKNYAKFYQNRIRINNPLKQKTMKKLITQIKNSLTATELESIINSMPNQENGFPTKLQRILENAFWYNDLTELESIKKWMLIRVNFYKSH